MGKKLIAMSLITAFILTVVVFVVVLSSPSKGQAQVVQQNPHSSASSMRPGRPAIVPRPTSNMALRAGTVFSEDDARKFASSYKMFREIGNMGSKNVISAQFMTSKEAGKLLDTPIGVADNDLVCVVEMKGTREMLAPGSSTPAPFSIAYLVFDGQTGNILVEGMNK